MRTEDGPGHEPGSNGSAGSNGKARGSPRAGRNAKGHFLPGNRFGKGNPFVRDVARFRSILIDAITDEDFRKIARKLVQLAKGGTQWAVHEVLNRMLGKSEQPIDLKDSGALREKMLEWLTSGK